MRILFIVLGFIFLGVGAVGIVVPILPTTPFLLLASFFFAKGSKRFHDWFLSTKLYKKYLESFVKSRAMTLKGKLTILIPVSCMLIITFILVDNIYARIVLVILFISKYVYFFTQIRTVSDEEL
ncbi:YbaN family protein, partial [uncultured Brachyspira sp.]